jgi:hypothetical protein
LCWCGVVLQGRRDEGVEVVNGSLPREPLEQVQWCFMGSKRRPGRRAPQSVFNISSRVVAWRGMPRRMKAGEPKAENMSEVQIVERKNTIYARCKSSYRSWSSIQTPCAIHVLVSYPHLTIPRLPITSIRPPSRPASPHNEAFRLRFTR